MQIRFLGHLEASVDDRPVALGGAKQRAVLAMLGLEANRMVTADHLIEGLWGEHAPASAAKMVQNYVWRLRGALAPTAARRSSRAGAAMSCASIPSCIDVRRFEQLLVRSRRAAEAGEPATPLARRWPCCAATRSPTWPTSRSRRAEIRRLEELRDDGGRAGDRRRPRRRSPQGGRRRDRGARWPRTRCASGCTRSGCSRCIGAGARRRRSRPTGTPGARWSRRSGSSRARSCGACTRRSCARTLRWTSSRPPPSSRASSPRRPRRRWSAATASCAGCARAGSAPRGRGRARHARRRATAWARPGWRQRSRATPTARGRRSSTRPGRDRRRRRSRPSRARAMRGGRRCWCSTTPTARQPTCTPRCASSRRALGAPPALVLATGQEAAALARLEPQDSITLEPLDAEAVARDRRPLRPGRRRRRGAGRDAARREPRRRAARPRGGQRVGAARGDAPRRRGGGPRGGRPQRGPRARGRAGRQRRRPAVGARARRAARRAPATTPRHRWSARTRASRPSTPTTPSTSSGASSSSPSWSRGSSARRCSRVVGPSGSGKSSAVRAGLLPALAGGVLPGSERWARVADPPRRAPDARACAARPTARAATGASSLVVDQFEELFTACRDEQERGEFVAALVRAARDPDGGASSSSPCAPTSTAAARPIPSSRGCSAPTTSSSGRCRATSCDGRSSGRRSAPG